MLSQTSVEVFVNIIYSVYLVPKVFYAVIKLLFITLLKISTKLTHNICGVKNRKERKLKMKTSINQQTNYLNYEIIQFDI